MLMILFISVLYLSLLGYASTIYSVDQAVQILDFIGQKSKSDDILPFAVRLVEGTDTIIIFSVTFTE
jgi:hypothetical protein